MLHRIRTDSNGVFVRPTMSFDERGHRPNTKIYYVCGCSGSGQAPESFYPTVEDFLGEGGTYTHPRAVCENYSGVPAGTTAAGKEAMGAFRFPRIRLAPGKEAEYILLLGVEGTHEGIARIYEKYNSPDKVTEVSRNNEIMVERESQHGISYRRRRF